MAPTLNASFCHPIPHDGLLWSTISRHRTMHKPPKYLWDHKDERQWARSKNFHSETLYNGKESLEFGVSIEVFGLPPTQQQHFGSLKTPSEIQKTLFMWKGKTYAFWTCWASSPHCTLDTHSLLCISVCFLQRFDKVSNMTIHYQVFSIISSVLIQKTSLVIFLHHNSSLYDSNRGEILTLISFTEKLSKLHIQTSWGCFLWHCLLFQFQWALHNKWLISACVVVAAGIVLITEYQVLLPGHDLNILLPGFSTPTISHVLFQFQHSD